MIRENVTQMVEYMPKDEAIEFASTGLGLGLSFGMLLALIIVLVAGFSIAIKAYKKSEEERMLEKMSKEDKLVYYESRDKIKS